MALLIIVKDFHISQTKKNKKKAYKKNFKYNSKTDKNIK